MFEIKESGQKLKYKNENEKYFEFLLRTKLSRHDSYFISNANLFEKKTAKYFLFSFLYFSFCPLSLISNIYISRRLVTYLLIYIFKVGLIAGSSEGVHIRSDIDK